MVGDLKRSPYLDLHDLANTITTQIASFSCDISMAYKIKNPIFAGKLNCAIFSQHAPVSGPPSHNPFQDAALS